MALAFFGCAQKEETTKGEQKDKVKEAVEEVVTREFKIYKGAKQSLQDVEKKVQERKEQQEKELN